MSVTPAAQKLAEVVLRRPTLTLSLALLWGCTAIYLWTSLLHFDVSFAALLPEDAPELQEVRELQKRAGGTVELVIAVGSSDKKKKLAFAREVVKDLQARPWIRRADVEFPVDFFLDRRMLLLPVEKLKKLREAIEDEVERARARGNPMYVDLEDEEDKKAAWSEVDGIEKLEDLPERTFTDNHKKHLFVRVKPRGTSSDMDQGRVTLSRIKAAVEAANPKKYGVTVRYAGGLVVNQEQHTRMNEDLQRASAVALVLIVLLISLYVRRFTAPVILAVPLIISVSTTLAITALTIGQLNLISGFLVSALFGLGIDFEIHLYLRYLEELSRTDDRREAMTRAIIRTFPGCLTAAVTTAAAFFAVAISDFRGFREYGQIAGMGVLAALLVTFLTLPPLAMMLGRKARRLKPVAPGGFRRSLAWIMVLTGTLLLVGSVLAARHVVWQSDFRKLRGFSEQVDFSEWVAELLGGSLSPAAILVNDIDQARRVEAYLKPLVSDPTSQVRQTLSLASMVPKAVRKKMPLLEARCPKDPPPSCQKGLIQILQDVLDQDTKKRLKPADRQRVKEALELARARPWGVADIPEVFRRRFLTVDEKAQFVVVWPRSKMFLEKEIIAWGRELARIRAELRAKGIPVKIMDENRLAARVLAKMRTDAPVMIGAASLAVLLILIIGFRNVKQVILVAGSLVVGVAWMLGWMVIGDLEINVFNQAILATIIGLGIDNAVHIQIRYKEEGPGALPKVLATTGSASFLASATTAIGFGAAVTAHHYGVQSMGWLAVVGLSCTFVASTIFFPSLLLLLEKRRST